MIRNNFHLNQAESYSNRVVSKIERRMNPRTCFAHKLFYGKK